MRYQLLALVHPTRVRISARANSIDAKVPGSGFTREVGVGTRVVAVMDCAHVLTPEAMLETARLFCSRLQGIFSRFGLMLSDPRLVPIGRTPLSDSGEN